MKKSKRTVDILGYSSIVGDEQLLTAHDPQSILTTTVNFLRAKLTSYGGDPTTESLRVRRRGDLFALQLDMEMRKTSEWTKYQ